MQITQQWGSGLRVNSTGAVVYGSCIITCSGGCHESDHVCGFVTKSNASVKKNDKKVHSINASILHLCVLGSSQGILGSPKLLHVRCSCFFTAEGHSFGIPSILGRDKSRSSSCISRSKDGNFSGHHLRGTVCTCATPHGLHGALGCESIVL